MHLIIYGPEGSGKGTQAKLLSEKLNIPVITSGDLVREKAKDNDYLGKACLKALSDGKYVDDATMFTLWKEKLESEEVKKGFILDGFPRNLHQAEFLLKEVEKFAYNIDKFLYIKISDEVSFRRLSKRERKLFEGSTESHDSPQRVKSRLDTFHKMETPLVAFFKKKNILLEIDGNLTVDEVFRTIIGKLGLE